MLSLPDLEQRVLTPDHECGCPAWVEEWRTIPKLPDYSVSTRGRVRRDTPGQGTKTGLLAQHTDDNGYPQVSIRPLGRVRVHWLVKATWFGPRQLGQQVNHEDGDKAHNCLANLTYVTPAENTQHAYATGLNQRGRSGHRGKLTIFEMREIYRASGSYSVLAQQYGVSKWTIRDIKKRRQWLSTEFERRNAALMRRE